MGCPQQLQPSNDDIVESIANGIETIGRWRFMTGVYDHLLAGHDRWRHAVAFRLDDQEMLCGSLQLFAYKTCRKEPAFRIEAIDMTTFFALLEFWNIGF